jgi:predicted N-formylglutamate amidohydrolase
MSGRLLLAPDEPRPVIERRRRGRSIFLLAVDHAGRRIPRSLGTLGLASKDLKRHIAWDIGALQVANQMADLLDATVVAQEYSRLVIDCNRTPGTEESIPIRSESTEIPGNVALSATEINARRAEIFEPYHAHVTELLDERLAAQHPTIFVAVHTMTDAFHGVRREMHGAVLYNRDRRFAGRVLDMLRRDTQLRIADNEPYIIHSTDHYTIPHHAEARGIPYVSLEIRQDLVKDEMGQSGWAQRVSQALQDAERNFPGAYSDA